MVSPNLAEPAVFYRQAAFAAKHLSRPLNLKEIRLPPGDVGSIALDWGNNGSRIRLASRDWLSEGYDGVRLIGDGLTYIRCRPGENWDGITFAVGRHPGVVQLEGVHLFAGTRAAVHFGQEIFAGQPEPKFQFRFLRSQASCLPPAEQNGVRSKWLLFGYNYDEYIEDVTLDAWEALEHARYRHGSASRGDLWRRVRVTGAAGECKKDRPESNETAWAGPNVWSISQACTFERWGAEHGNWKKGGGLIYQNACGHILIEDCTFRGRLGHNDALHVVANGNSYDMLTGQIDKGFGNGYVGVRRCGFTGEAEGFWNNSLINVYRDGAGPPMAAMGFFMEDSGLFGRNTIVSPRSMPGRKTLVRRCNTAEMRAIAQSVGIDTAHETVIPTSSRLVPISEGWSG